MRLLNTGIRLVHIAGHDIGPGKTSDHVEDRSFRRGGKSLSLHEEIERAPLVRCGAVKIIRGRDESESPPAPPPPPAPAPASPPPAP